MKMIVLGGCADMAVPLLSLLKDDAGVTQVTLADINQPQACRLAADCGDKFQAAFCDATDEENVIRVLQGHQVALSYIGPFYVFEKPLAQCALAARVPYISIADDYDAYLNVLTLEDEAREQGVKLLTGFGNSPGLTQILARKGYNDLAGASRINIHWCAGSDESVGPSNLTHLFHIFNGTTLQTINGREVRVKTGTGKKLVDFPEPIGRNPVYYTGHAESVSLPRNLEGLTEVTLHGGVKPNYIVVLVKLLSRLRLLNSHARRSALARFFHTIEGWFASAGIDKSVGRIDIYGEAEKRIQYKYFTYVGHIAEITSLPAYLAAKWLCAGQFDHLPGGVYAPERLLEQPEAFIKELKNLGIEIYESDVRPRA